MFVNKTQIQIGLINYIENEIAKKVDTDALKFGLTFLAPYLSKTAIKKLDTISEMLEDIKDENGKLDLEELYGNAKNSIRKVGQFIFKGFIFSETDVDKLYEYIKRTGEN
jgi:hypothetical protein